MASRVGRSLDRGAAYVFFHKLMQKKVGRPPAKRRTRRPRAKFTFLSDPILPPEQECILMWRNDTWLLKYAMLDTVHTRRHANKLAREKLARASIADRDSSSDAS